MIRENISIDDTIKLLNELLVIDKLAITSLIKNLVECNEDLANHESVQVWKDLSGDAMFHVGLMGILNGLFGADNEGIGAICFEQDDNTNEIIKFKRTKK